MAERRGPDEGYDFGNKRQYRRNVWNTFSTFCGAGCHIAEAALMPSIEGDEIDVALSKGFRRLHVIDRNPAIVATLRRRYPFLTETYGVSLGDAAGQRRATWDILNADLCSNVNPSSLAEIARGASNVSMGLIAVTALRGREQGDAWMAIEDLSSRGIRFSGPTGHLSRSEVNGPDMPERVQDRARVFLIQSAIAGWEPLEIVRGREVSFGPAGNVYISRYGQYRSTAGNQTMLWAIFKKHWPDCLCDLCYGSWGISRGLKNYSDAIDDYVAARGNGLTHQDMSERFYARLVRESVSLRCREGLTVGKLLSEQRERHQRLYGPARTQDIEIQGSDS